MKHYSKEEIEKAKEIDLFTYLSKCNPNELVQISPNNYCTKTHDSLKISNGKWMWWSRGIGGYTALDYLIKVEGYSFPKAIGTILNETSNVVILEDKPKVTKEKILELPLLNDNQDKVKAYLMGRGIDGEIVDECIKKGLILESLPYHNVIFLGMDKDKKARFASYRGTRNKRSMGELRGSDKHYSFRLEGKNKESLHLFECAIDLLSYATLLKQEGKDYKDYNLLSLAGVYATQKDINESKLPVALVNFLEEHKNINKIYLHLDNDYVGNRASLALEIKLSNDYEVVNAPPEYGKDYNDFLCAKLGILQEKEGRNDR